MDGDRWIDPTTGRVYRNKYEAPSSAQFVPADRLRGEPWAQHDTMPRWMAERIARDAKDDPRTQRLDPGAPAQPPAPAPPRQAPGLYRDPGDASRVRYFNGGKWTAETRPLPKAGWYEVPGPDRRLRLFDGQRWTRHTAVLGGPAPGWYPWQDGAGSPAVHRWWNGVSWTAHVSAGGRVWTQPLPETFPDE